MVEPVERDKYFFHEFPECQRQYFSYILRKYHTKPDILSLLFSFHTTNGNASTDEPADREDSRAKDFNDGPPCPYTILKYRLTRQLQNLYDTIKFLIYKTSQADRIGNTHAMTIYGRSRIWIWDKRKTKLEAFPDPFKTFSRASLVRGIYTEFPYLPYITQIPCKHDSQIPEFQLVF